MILFFNRYIVVSICDESQRRSLWLSSISFFYLFFRNPNPNSNPNLNPNPNPSAIPNSNPNCIVLFIIVMNVILSFK